jgi:hypothetical protein
MIKHVYFALITLFYISYVALNAQSYQLSIPTWVSEPETGLRSIGIARKGALSSEKTAEKAFIRALESLNANRRTWLLAEHYDRAMNEYESFYEFSIQEMLDSTSVKLTNQYETDDWLFIELEPTERPKSSEEEIIWIEAVGSYSLLETNPHYSFEKAKQQALKKIAYQTDLKVSGRTFDVNGYSNDLFFIKSRIRVEFVTIQARWISEGRAHVHIKVDQKNVATF